MIGASGGIFAIFGMCVAPQVRAGRLDRDELWSSGQQVIIKSWLVLLILNAILGFVIPNIGWQAHAGGLIVGLLIGFALPVKGKLTVRVSRPAIVSIVGTRSVRRTTGSGGENQLIALSIAKTEEFDDSRDFVVLFSEKFGWSGKKEYSLEKIVAGICPDGVHSVSHSLLLADPRGVQANAIASNISELI